MHIIILLAAILTSSFIIFPIVEYIKQKKLSHVNGVQFLLLFFISIFYIAIGSWQVSIDTTGVIISLMTIIIVVSAVVLVLSFLYLLLGAIIPFFKKRKQRHHNNYKSESHSSDTTTTATIA